MIKIKNLALTVLASTMIACSNTDDQDATNLHKQADDLLYPKGEKITNNNFVGNAWLTGLVTADSANKNAVGSVTFEAGARTNWHMHPAGQIILATGGVGYYQEKGSPKRTLEKGDVVKCPPNVPHWHGASADQAFIQIAITGRQNGPTEWLHAVTDEEYLQ
ncbi:quercetin dioxygenase-like cupin family protein [Catalinimonas alkaloidigena]|uniref:cupin domain-containing protein n=1 Tax=Catalinimonas alkaloidigena TaxID=1075417 RepID=UPI0030B8D170|nr:quercetin dioxygenase-like cupin family protein [Catalinimonas alkaloidigena]